MWCSFHPFFISRVFFLVGVVAENLRKLLKRQSHRILGHERKDFACFDMFWASVHVDKSIQVVEYDVNSVFLSSYNLPFRPGGCICLELKWVKSCRIANNSCSLWLGSWTILLWPGRKTPLPSVGPPFRGRAEGEIQDSQGDQSGAKRRQIQEWEDFEDAKAAWCQKIRMHMWNESGMIWLFWCLVVQLGMDWTRYAVSTTWAKEHWSVFMIHYVCFVGCWIGEA